MNEKIFLSNKELKTIAELKAIGEINLPVFKDGTKMYKTSLSGLLDNVKSLVVIDTASTRQDIINIINADKIPLFKTSQGQGSKYLYPAWLGGGPMTFGSIEKDYYWFATIDMEGVWTTGYNLLNDLEVVVCDDSSSFSDLSGFYEDGKTIVYRYVTGAKTIFAQLDEYRTTSDEPTFVFTSVTEGKLYQFIRMDDGNPSAKAQFTLCTSLIDMSGSYPEGMIVQYKGETDDTYTTGFFYKMVSGSWTQLYVQPRGGTLQDELNNLDDPDPLHQNIIADLVSLSFYRETGGSNFASVSGQVGDTPIDYGILLPTPSIQGDIGKVPKLNSGGQIEWEEMPSEGSVSVEIANAIETVKTNNIYTIPLGSIQNAITPIGSGTLYSYWTIISPSMDFPLSTNTTLSFLVKQLGSCTNAYLAIYEIDGYNQKMKWVANTNDFHASLSLGYNYIKLAYISLSAKLSSSKLYYVAFISNINSVRLAGNSFETQFNGLPRLASKIENINTSFNAATLQSIYNEFNLSDGSEILDRLFINISNVEYIVDPFDPTPFTALTNTTVNNSNKVSAIAPTATTFGANGILYQKVISNLDISISSVWILDYHSSQNANLPALFILDDDLNTITSVNVPALTNAGTSEKIGNYYVHKYSFSTPITLQEGIDYWIPAIGNCSNGTSEWAIQYTAADPSIPIRDMLAVSDITNFSTADKVIVNNKNGCYLKIIDSDSTEWLI